MACFIFMAASSGSRSVNKKMGKPVPVEHKTGMHHFDSNGICTCIPFINKDELDNFLSRRENVLEKLITEWIPKNKFPFLHDHNNKLKG